MIEESITRLAEAINRLATTLESNKSDLGILAEAFKIAEKAPTTTEVNKPDPKVKVIKPEDVEVPASIKPVEVKTPTAATEVTMVELRRLTKLLLDVKQLPVVQAIVKANGVARISETPPEKFEAVAAALREAVATYVKVGELPMEPKG